MFAKGRQVERANTFNFCATQIDNTHEQNSRLPFTNSLVSTHSTVTVMREEKPRTRTAAAAAVVLPAQDQQHRTRSHFHQHQQHHRHLQKNSRKVLIIFLDLGGQITIKQFLRLFIFYACLVVRVPAEMCPTSSSLFELVTGQVLSAPSATLDSQPETLILDDCLASCRRNSSCAAINYETGLCILFSTDADEQPNALSSSQYPVFTLYGQKMCVPDDLAEWTRGNSEWAWERVPGIELAGHVKKHRRVVSRVACALLCLQEEEFVCRSANYEMSTGTCYLNDMNRFSINNPGALRQNPRMDYLENHYVPDPARLCEYQKVEGRIMKTVDAVYRNVSSLDGCRHLCGASPFRCRSFDFGATDADVCRLSHHSSASLSLIDQPYLEIPDSATYELSACYNVTVECRSSDMVAKIVTNRLFNGKVYAKTRPRSCVTDVSNELEFDLRMSYSDVNCDVKRDGTGTGSFSNDIVLQHHDLIVTNQDLGLSIHCQYDLQNKSVSNGVNLNVQGEMKNVASEAASVPSPNVSMKIISRSGTDLGSAQVGDSLSLRFEIVDRNSPYEIFVRELVASDGLPGSSEILLIDSLGCPTDATIMGPLIKVSESGQELEAPFDAFKFPSSEVVQFKALVTPCLPTCEPVQCQIVDGDGSSQSAESLGRRRRRRRGRAVGRVTSSQNSGSHLSHQPSGKEYSKRLVNDDKYSVFQENNNTMWTVPVPRDHNLLFLSKSLLVSDRFGFGFGFGQHVKYQPMNIDSTRTKKRSLKDLKNGHPF